MVRSIREIRFSSFHSFFRRIIDREGMRCEVSHVSDVSTNEYPLITDATIPHVPMYGKGTVGLLGRVV